MNLRRHTPALRAAMVAAACSVARADAELGPTERDEQAGLARYEEGALGRAVQGAAAEVIAMP